MMPESEPMPGWEAELDAFLEKAAESITQQAALLTPPFFDVGVGEALSDENKYLTIFIKSDAEQEGYALSLCLNEDGAEKLIAGLVHGYRYLWARDTDGI